jgi:hypothetical protein
MNSLQAAHQNGKPHEDAAPISQALVALADQALPGPRRRRVPPHEGMAETPRHAPQCPQSGRRSASSARSRSPRSFSPDFDNLSPTVAGRPTYKTHKNRKSLPPEQIPPRGARPFVGCSPHRTGLRPRMSNPGAQRGSLTMKLFSPNGEYPDGSFQVERAPGPTGAIEAPIEQLDLAP